MALFLLLLFAIYCYLPHIAFKTAAEWFVDLGRKRDSTAVDGVISVILPAAAFHGITFLLVALAEQSFRFKFPQVDWDLLSRAIVAPERELALAEYVSAGRFGSPAFYLCALLIVAAGNGFLWGRLELARLRLSLDGEFEGSEVRRLFYVAGAPFWQLWNTFYQEYSEPLFELSAKQAFVFVKSRDQRIVYGRFLRYEKLPSGPIDSIRLTQVRRYRSGSAHAAVRAGLNPFQPLEGAFDLRWAEVTDINIVDEAYYHQLWWAYEIERLWYIPNVGSDGREREMDLRRAVQELALAVERIEYMRFFDLIDRLSELEQARLDDLLVAAIAAVERSTHQASSITASSLCAPLSVLMETLIAQPWSDYERSVRELLPEGRDKLQEIPFLDPADHRASTSFRDSRTGRPFELTPPPHSSVPPSEAPPKPA